MRLNNNEVNTIYIDLNSCFATAEQQANPFYRNRPLAVAAYTGPSGVIVSPSYEAKALGIRLGTRVGEAKKICPDIIIKPPDPIKYRYIHIKFKEIFSKYSDIVTPLSIDEAYLKMASMTDYWKNKLGTVDALETLLEVSELIKADMRKNIGEYISCNIGISTNVFYAKVAAGLNKPDGLDYMNNTNIRAVLSRLVLTDFPGINVRYSTRLRLNKIYTPIEFLDTSDVILRRRVFKSIAGLYWYMRLRGYEIDDNNTSRKGYSQSYSMPVKHSKIEDLEKIVMKLAVKLTRRMRADGYSCSFIAISVNYTDHGYWSDHLRVKSSLFNEVQIHRLLVSILKKNHNYTPVSKIYISVTNLSKLDPNQLQLIPDNYSNIDLVNSLDDINNKYGEYSIIPALLMDMDEKVIDRISFGGVKELSSEASIFSK